MKFEHEMFEYRRNNFISFDKYLSFLNMLLIDKIIERFENHSNAICLLNDSFFIQNTVEIFKTIFCNRFSFRIVEIVSMFTDVKLIELKQKFDEILVSYYKRMTSLMQRIDARDRFLAKKSILSSLKSAMLNIILYAFIRELIDSKIRREAIRDMISANKFLKTIYQLAKKARRINIKIQKLYEKEIRQNELSFYRHLILQFLSKIKIEIIVMNISEE